MAQAAKPKILVIDDEEALVKSIQRTLQKEYDLFAAYSGAQGLQLARQVQPDLIILDIIMPGMDGYETCRHLRQDPALQSVPILFLSALSTVESKLTGFDIGADDYLTKPFDIRELLSRVRAILRRSTTPSPEQAGILLKQGDIVLNCHTFEVTTRNGVHALTPTEFELLYFFMHHPNQVFTGLQLLQRVWKYPPETGNPSLVRMHIKNLRQKMEPDPRRPRYIKTVPRHGYLLNTRSDSQ